MKHTFTYTTSLLQQQNTATSFRDDSSSHYEDLKKAILECPAPAYKTDLNSFLAANGLGGHKPSEFLIHLKLLLARAGTIFSKPVLRDNFFKCLPPLIRCHVLYAGKLPLEKVAVMTNRILTAMPTASLPTSMPTPSTPVVAAYQSASYGMALTSPAPSNWVNRLLFPLLSFPIAVKQDLGCKTAGLVYGMMLLPANLDIELPSLYTFTLRPRKGAL